MEIWFSSCRIFSTNSIQSASPLQKKNEQTDNAKNLCTAHQRCIQGIRRMQLHYDEDGRYIWNAVQGSRWIREKLELIKNGIRAPKKRSVDSANMFIFSWIWFWWYSECLTHEIQNPFIHAIWTFFVVAKTNNSSVRSKAFSSTYRIQYAYSHFSLVAGNISVSFS